MELLDRMQIIIISLTRRMFVSTIDNTPPVATVVFHDVLPGMTSRVRQIGRIPKLKPHPL